MKRRQSHAIHDTSQQQAFASILQEHAGLKKQVKKAHIESTYSRYIWNAFGSVVEFSFKEDSNEVEVVFLDNHDRGGLCNGRVCIKVHNNKHTNGPVLVNMDGIIHEVWVKGIG
ncbi:hypothetical protein LXL04_015521 [Taraxacum kok-saghyz]